MQKVSKMVEIAVVLTALTVLTWGATSARAAVVDGATETFKQFDADADGYVSAGEAVKAEIASEAFLAADRNQDGKLSLEEFASASAEGGDTRKP
jgi:Ca2+-binding EF-hand superfamily protein